MNAGGRVHNAVDRSLLTLPRSCILSRVRSAACLDLLLTLLLWRPTHARAQGNPRPDSAVQPVTAHPIRWYNAMGAAVGVGALMLVDQPVQRFAQRHRSSTTNGAASVFRHGGQPEVFGTVSLGLIAVGFVTHRPAITATGGRLVATLGLAGAATITLKALIGRARPDAGVGAFDFDPLTHSDALPSGHTAMAFALAAGLSEAVRSRWAHVGFYGFATGTALARINDNRHWLSDAGMGALIGVASAKLVSGRWRVFGLGPPGVAVGPRRTLIFGWQRRF